MVEFEEVFGRESVWINPATVRKVSPSGPLPQDDAGPQSLIYFVGHEDPTRVFGLHSVVAAKLRGEYQVRVGL